MKNAFYSFLVSSAVMAFFSFTSNRPHLITEQDSDDEQEIYAADTVPHKKDSAKHRSKTVPYDSFGKPKKMDTTSH